MFCAGVCADLVGWERHVFPPENRRGPDLPADRRIPARGEGGAPACSGDPWPRRGILGDRQARLSPSLRGVAHGDRSGAVGGKRRRRAGGVEPPVGAPLIFERLWQESGCRAVIEAVLSERKFEFPVERAIFA